MSGQRRKSLTWGQANKKERKKEKKRKKEAAAAVLVCGVDVAIVACVVRVCVCVAGQPLRRSVGCGVPRFFGFFWTASSEYSSWNLEVKVVKFKFISMLLHSPLPRAAPVWSARARARSWPWWLRAGYSLVLAGPLSFFTLPLPSFLSLRRSVF